MPAGSPSTPAIRRLRAAAVAGSLRPPAGLADAIRALGFVQYDPIRRPATAQDLIMRHRVAGYRQGDLERSYDEAGIEEDRLHVYGALPAGVAAWLHPRVDPRAPDGIHRPDALAAEVLAAVRDCGPATPRDLALRFGPTRAVNDWGGFSAATTRALEALHRYGLVRVTGRRAGMKVYAPAARPEHALDLDERLRRLALHLAHVYAPVQEAVLRANLALVARAATGRASRLSPAVVARLMRSGELEAEIVDGVRYLRPAAAGQDPPGPGDVPGGVRLLAPFDPVVWDRARFEHLWGWAYRFEAYTPASRRLLGYYTLPVLLGDRVVGWATCETAGGRVAVRYGFAGRPHRGRTFRRALDADVDRLAAMLDAAVDSIAPADGPPVIDRGGERPASSGAAR